MSIINKIIKAHLSPVSQGSEVVAGAILDIEIDVRAARDFGGANVVKNIRDQGLTIADPSKTIFTFDCNPTGSDQKYAANQHVCRMFARERGLRVYDIDSGIGTHVAVENNVVSPGCTFVSTDSHANIMGAIGTFGQGMGDIDIAGCFARGSIWFKVPKAAKVILKGKPSPLAQPKDVALAMAQKLGANGLLGYAAEATGEYVDGLNLAGRITIASMGTEMGAIIVFFTPNATVLKELGLSKDYDVSLCTPDKDAKYDAEFVIDIEGLGPMAARPGHPDDVIAVEDIKGRAIDSAFIGSCTNGRYEDMEAAAKILKGRKIAPGIVLKIVPSTRPVWDKCLENGIINIFMEAGALVGNSGCAGCAAGQIGQNGPGEITVSTGNRNFPGKQGKGEVYLASPATVAASAVAGCITTVAELGLKPLPREAKPVKEGAKPSPCGAKPTLLEGRAWVISVDNIDTDMIFHNQYLHITDIEQMGQYAFDNLEGWKDFAKRAKAGDIIVTGKNFGCGSSRQQAVDCFKNLGISCIVAESYGAIYERNAINGGFPAMVAVPKGIDDGDVLVVDLEKSTIFNKTKNANIECSPFSSVQMDIYKRGGLLCKSDW